MKSKRRSKIVSSKKIKSHQKGNKRLVHGHSKRVKGRKTFLKKNFSQQRRKMPHTETHEDNIKKLVKKLLGDDSIDSIPGCDEEVNLLQDLDLLVLGSAPKEYKRYKELLRKEYSHLDDASYKRMRLKQNDQQPSTSRQAAVSTATSPCGQNKRSPAKKKPFVKFKDSKYRENLAQKFKHRTVSKTRIPLGLNAWSSPSLSQVISRKIVHQIKKRNCQINNKNSSKLTIRSMRGETSPQCTDNATTPEDDDCICIETKPEIILIDDDSIAPVNVVKELENKYLKLKHYEAIGSIRMKQSQENNNMHILTSTPNTANHLSSSQVKFHEETNSRFGSITSESIQFDSEDVTIVEDVNGQSNDVICIHDTLTPRNSLRQRRKRNRMNTDDSVIFVSEKVSSSPKSTLVPAPAFIPLNTPLEEVKVALRPMSPSPPRPKRKCTLFSSNDEKMLKQYNENAYNPNKNAVQEPKKKRMVIVDGSNVAYQHALNKEFSVEGLKICLDYFDSMGHEVKAVVPQYRLQKQRSSNPTELENLHRAGKIVFTPCKNLPGKSSTSYDDRFILQLAAELDAAVVSNDNYRDLLNENSAFKKLIENRVIGYTWCNDLFILPKDPYGKWGPTLASILNRDK